MYQALLIITGRVQGVAFRYSARKKALLLGLSGYAKNLPDGSVESLIQGRKETIKRYIDWCRQGGPLSAEVKDVKVSWQRGTCKIEDFEVL